MKWFWREFLSNHRGRLPRCQEAFSGRRGFCIFIRKEEASLARVVFAGQESGEGRVLASFFGPSLWLAWQAAPISSSHLLSPVHNLQTPARLSARDPTWGPSPLVKTVRINGCSLDITFSSVILSPQTVRSSRYCNYPHFADGTF